MKNALILIGSPQKKGSTESLQQKQSGGLKRRVSRP